MAATPQPSSVPRVSPLGDWVAALLADPQMLRMGHAQRAEDDNLGLGWLYYALGRIVRPSSAVVIGSLRGFVPSIVARAMADNAERGVLHFIDPSLVDDQWRDPEAVASRFAGLGLDNVVHHRLTTQGFVETEAYARLADIGIVFVDGYHTREQATFDVRSFLPKLAPDGIVLMHDSLRRRVSRIYGPDMHYTHEVCDVVAELREDPSLDVFELPFGDGVAMIRRVRPEGSGGVGP